LYAATSTAPPAVRHSSVGRRTLRVALGLLLVLAATAMPRGPAPGQIAPAIAAVRHLVFDDEFMGTTLDRTKWSTTYPWGARTNYGNQELEYYTDDAFQVRGGMLSIRAQRRTVHGFSFTSGIVTSYDSFAVKYGYFEIRAKVPKGQGLWPTFWLAPKDMSWPPEVDIFELRGQEPTVDTMSDHFSTARGPRQLHYAWTGPDFSQDFHTFALRWTPTELVWYVDGLERLRTTSNIPNKPMYLIVNLAVGGNWPGAPDWTTPFPSYLDVIYVRVYEG
jgi:beta-glucanase (GH16 family)